MKLLVVDQSKFLLKNVKNQVVEICLSEVFLAQGVTQLTTVPLKAILVKKTKIR